jgi:transcriptional regulator with XRE-family HTH domain
MPTRSQIRTHVGEVLRSKREERGLTQEELGFAGNLHRNYVGSVERGERNISVEALGRWLAALHFRWEEFGQAVDRKRVTAVPRSRR